MARKKKHKSEPSGVWLISYADLMTLLFCVFVVLYALKPEGQGADGDGDGTSQLDSVMSSIREAFNQIPDDIPEADSGQPTEQNAGQFEYFKGELIHEPVIRRHIRSDKVVPVINREMQEVKDKIEIILREEKRPDIDPTPDRHRPIAVLPDKDGFTIRLLSSYFFASGEYQITGEAWRQVEAIGKVLRELNRRVSIEGHTDSVPAGGRIGNWEMSSLRSAAVARIFVNDLGFANDKISISGYAETRPIATNRTEEGRRLNRRVEIKVQYDE